MKTNGNVVHDKGVRLAREIAEVTSSWPAGNAYLSDQLRRAVSSVVLNYAEGRGRSSSAERERFFTVARGSVHEVRAALDLCLALGLLSTEEHAGMADDCEHVSAVLWKHGAK